MQTCSLFSFISAGYLCSKSHILLTKLLSDTKPMSKPAFMRKSGSCSLPPGFAVFEPDSHFIRQLHAFEEEFVELLDWINAHFEWQTTYIPSSAKTTNRPGKKYQDDKPNDCPQNIHCESVVLSIVNLQENLLFYGQLWILSLWNSKKYQHLAVKVLKRLSCQYCSLKGLLNWAFSGNNKMGGFS